MSDEELDSVFRRVADEYPQDAPPPGAWERLDTRLATTTATQRLRHKVLRGLGVELAALAVLLWQGAQLLPPPTHWGRPLGAGQPAASHPAARLATELATPASAASSATLPVVASAVAPVAPGILAASTVVAGSATSAATANPAAPVGASTSANSATASAGLPRVSAAAADGASAALAAALATGNVRRTQQHLAGRSRLALLKEASGQQASQARKYRVFETKNEVIAGRVYGLKIGEKPIGSFGFGVANLSKSGLAETAAAGRVARLALGSFPLPDSLAGLALQPLADSATKPKSPTLRPPYRLVVGLVGAPSFSAVRTPQTAQLGGDYGLTLEYVLTSRLWVRAGLISSQKRYRAASSDYEAPAAWQWFAGDYVLDANCRITEVPLDLRFDVLRRPSYAVFSSLGINSLLMRNERYSYDWTMNGQTFTKTAQVLNGSNHFLSVLNVSVGVERPIGGRWSAQVEPFWQFPLGGVGAGQVRLSSAGASFSLKFGLIR